MHSRFFIRVLGATAILIVLVLTYFVGTTGMVVDDAYAQWGAETLVIEYMESHDGQWPRSWDDLRPLYSDTKARVGSWSFEKFGVSASTLKPMLTNSASCLSLPIQSPD